MRSIWSEPIQGEGGIRAAYPGVSSAAPRIDEEVWGAAHCGRNPVWTGANRKMVCVSACAAFSPMLSRLPSRSQADCRWERFSRLRKPATAFHPGMHGTTFGGGPLTSAVAVAVLNTIEKEGLMKNAVTVGNYFRSRLDELAAKHAFVREIRSMGLMLGVELDSPEKAKTVVKEALAKGMILNRTNDTVLRFLPPFILQKKHVDEAMKVIATDIQQLWRRNEHVKQTSGFEARFRPSRSEEDAGDLWVVEARSDLDPGSDADGNRRHHGTDGTGEDLSERVRARTRWQADRAVLREAIAPHAADV